MSLRGVVQNLEETPSSQVRAFWRDTDGATETMSVPTAADAKARTVAARAIVSDALIFIKAADAIFFFIFFLLIGLLLF